MPLDEWRAFERAHPAPTFFARPAWSESIAAAYPSLSPAAWRVPLEDDVVVLPLMESRLRGVGWPAYVGMPLGGYVAAATAVGRLVGTGDILAAARAVLDAGAASVAVTPWPMLDRESDQRRGLDEDVLSPASGVSHCAVIDLRAGIDAAVARMDSRARRNAGAAVRRGVTCAAESGAAAMRAYADLLAHAVGRKRASAVPPGMLHALAGLGGGDVEVWSARADGEIIAGGILLYGAREAFFWSAAMRDDAGQLRPSNLLNLEMLRASAARGMHWFNLGASEGLPGVHRFKMSLGAVDVAYRTTALESAAYRAYRALRSAVGRAL